MGDERPSVLSKFTFPTVVAHSVLRIGHFRVSKTLTLKTRPSARPFLWKMSLICMKIKTHFRKNGFALGLVLKQRPAASRKWPIGLQCTLILRKERNCPIKKKKEKIDRSPYSFTKKNDNLLLWRALAIKNKPPCVLKVRELITREIMDSQDPRYGTS